MDNDNLLAHIKQLTKSLVIFSTVIIVIGSFLLFLILNPNSSLFKSTPEVTEIEIDSAANTLETISVTGIENGIHVATGFVEGEGLEAVINNCTNCHSAKLVTQNRMSREGWLTTIRWMQETQNLWDLGDQENDILDYLATNYAPKAQGRRANLEVEDWYKLED
ncbi:monoheme cytochrome C [Galbibacter sp. BG1]|uniref:monoheme cytochrome C n=1 Tax=Galbibacter sp. BG1 TaxID=1170699 RepID=UPI0015BC38F2|nr:monoheme cytochrome C [Galbibacter sp. BG1]QLE03006.1 monoheme cytochrome C [Galbibacter sp. BG1]